MLYLHHCLLFFFDLLLVFAYPTHTDQTDSELSFHQVLIMSKHSQHYLQLYPQTKGYFFFFSAIATALGIYLLTFAAFLI